MAIGFTSGALVGGALSPDETVPAVGSARVDSTAPGLGEAATLHGEFDFASDEEREALAQAWMTNLWLAGKVQSLESLIDDLEGWDVDPTWLAERVVGTLDPDELRAVISMATRLGEEDLDEIEDIDTFAMRLTEIAMEGTLVDEGEPLDAASVQFGTGSSDIEDPSMLSGRFDPDQRRIYAFFSTGDYSGREVMVKWYRTDEPKVMVFKRHRIRAGSEGDYVWLQPRAGWESGDYRVDVYTGDEAMTQLAMGRYSVE